MYICCSVDIKPDMDLSEFVQITEARAVPQTQDWIVVIPLADGTKSNLTVSNCYTEFEAKERSFFYLLERINLNNI